MKKTIGVSGLVVLVLVTVWYWGRDMVWWLGRKVCGSKLRELAALAGVTTEASVSLGVKRFEERLGKDEDLRKKIETIKVELLKC